MKKRGMHRYAKPAVKQVDVRATSSVVETVRQDSLQSVRLGGSERLIQREFVELLTSADLFARRSARTSENLASEDSATRQCF